MRNMLLAMLLLVPPSRASAEDRVYEGTWLTSNRPLDGTMTCVVTDLGDNQWRGHFSGTWEGQEFSYKVDFPGPPEKLHGRATIDGAEYEWFGEITKGPPGTFKGRFG